MITAVKVCILLVCIVFSSQNEDNRNLVKNCTIVTVQYTSAWSTDTNRNRNVINQEICIDYIGFDKGQALQRLHPRKKRFAYGQVSYYHNHSATFNVEFLSCHGDIQPNPGPRNQDVGELNHELSASNKKQSNSSGMSVFYANARSIVNKVDLIEIEISVQSYDIFVFTKTHLDNSIVDSELFPQNYTIFRRDRVNNGRHGGGVLLAVNDTIKAFQRHNLLCDHEILFVNIILSKNRNITVGVFYMPPNSDNCPLVSLQSALDELRNSNGNTISELLIIGDFNLPDFDWPRFRALKNTENYILLTDIIHDNFLTQLVNKPTRQQNILDLVFATAPDTVYDLEVGEPFSDHNSITFFLSKSPYEKRE
jgi:hypothetical protein